MSLTGAWRIVEMDLWDPEAVDLLGPGFTKFGADRSGQFRFIAVQGWMDCHHGRRDGRPCVEFTWEGDDDGDPASGRGRPIRRPWLYCECRWVAQRGLEVLVAADTTPAGRRHPRRGFARV